MSLPPPRKTYLYQALGKTVHQYRLIKTVQFQPQNYFNVSEMIYNCIWNKCSIIFTHNAAVKWSEFDQTPCTYDNCLDECIAYQNVCHIRWKQLLFTATMAVPIQVYYSLKCKHNKQYQKWITDTCFCQFLFI